MGSSLSRQNAAQITIDPQIHLQNDLPKFIFQEKVGNGKFLKSYSMKIDGVEVVVKVYLKQNDEELQPYAARLTHIWKTISPAKHPYLLPYQMWIKSTTRIPRSLCTPVYLIRQYFASSLCDRLATRPFLTYVEKLWIIYQLLKAVEACHGEGICHGDLNTNNFMITSWNFIVLTDFASFKPSQLPEDDPSDFQYYYDSSGYGRCYVSPERFYKRSQVGSSTASLTSSNLTTSPLDVLESVVLVPQMKSSESLFVASMDIFSLGCVMAEVLLDGECILDLPAMLKFLSLPDRKGRSLTDDDSPASSSFNKISDVKLKNMLSEMTKKDPTLRPTAKECREDLENVGVFPTYFKLLYKLLLKLHWYGTSPDDRIDVIAKSYSDLILEILNFDDKEGGKFFANAIAIQYDQYHKRDRERTDTSDDLDSTPKHKYTNADISSARKRPNQSAELKSSVLSQKDPSNGTVNLTLENLISEFEAMIVKAKDGFKSDEVKDIQADTGTTKDPVSTTKTIVAPKSMSDVTNCKIEKSDDGLLIIIQIICANLRHLRYSQSKVVSLLMLIRLGSFSSNCNKGSGHRDIIVKRILPFVVTCLEDASSIVRATAVKTIKLLLRAIKPCCIGPTDAKLFDKFLIPALNVIAKDPELVVRIAFAESIGQFATSAKVFLEMSHFYYQTNALATGISENGDGSVNVIADAKYDRQVHTLHTQISRWISDIVFDGTTSSSSSYIVDIRKSTVLVSATSSPLKRSLLNNIVQLCVFSGSHDNSMDILLSQVLTFLNDQDWELRKAFCEQIPTVCTFVGPVATGECILPCLENALTDVSESVIASAVRALCTLVEMNLISKALIILVVNTTAPLLLHPYTTIRQNTIALVAASARCLGTTDSYIFLLPVIKPALRIDLIGLEMTESILNLCLLEPLSRKVFSRVLKEKRGELPKKKEENSLPKLREESIKEGNEGNDDDHRYYFEDKDASSPSTITRDTVTSPATGLTIDVSGSKDAGDEEEIAKLAYMSTYLDAASKEMNQKMIQWRSNFRLPDNNRNSVTVAVKDGSTQGYVKNIGGQDAFIDLMVTQMASLQGGNGDNLVKNLYIPHQKHSLKCYLPQSDSGNTRDVPGNLSSLAGHDENLIVRQYGVKLYGLGEVNVNEAAMAYDNRSKSSTTLTVATNEGMKEAEPEITKDIIPKLQALRIPPLAPNFGQLIQPIDGKKFSAFNEQLDLSFSPDAQANTLSWRPKENTVISTLSEHSMAVNRLAISQDQLFFVSASSDGTAKVWQTKGLEKTPYPKSVFTYTEQKGALQDVVMIENTHSVATCSDQGSIHVWRVDIGPRITNKQASFSENSAPLQYTSATTNVSGVSTVRTVDPREGPIVGLQHYCGDVSSMLTYVTQSGIVHGWDLRCQTEAFTYKIRPELGYATALTTSSDRNWICLGTSQGYIGLYDLRYNVLSKLWRHSARAPIHRLASCKIPTTQSSNTSKSSSETSGAYLFVASGRNEAAVWSLPEAKECLKCFRAVPYSLSRTIAPLPELLEIEIPSDSHTPFTSSDTQYNTSTYSQSIVEPSIRAIMGRISSNSSAFLITAGTDRMIRYWDFTSPTKCFTVSGLDAGQPRSVYESSTLPGLKNKLVMCYDSQIPSLQATLQSEIPMREYRGPIVPPSIYKDSILDLKSLDFPIRMLLSSSKDGEIKLWR